MIIKDLDFTVITSKADFKLKRNALLEHLGQGGKQFEYFVVATVNYFYNEGNNSIFAINGLLAIANASRGMNASRLAAYLKKVIPHELNEGNNLKSIAPQFTAKKEGANYPKPEKVADFVYRNPSWSKFGKQSSSKDFELGNYLASVVAKLEREGVDAKTIASISIIADGKRVA